MTVLFVIQTNINNAFNATINLTSNEIIYDFKIRNRLTTILKNFNEQFKFMSNQKLKKNLDDTRFQFRQKTSNVIFFDNVKIKLMYDKRHKPFLLKEKIRCILNFIKNINFQKIKIENC